VNEFIKTCSNIRSLRAALRELPFDTIADMRDKFIQIVDERAIEEEQRLKEEQEKAEKRKAILDMMQEEGITMEELLAEAPTKAAPKSSRPAKYIYQDDNGVTKTWTGQGRKPAPIQRAIENGGSLDDFLNPDVTTD
jgi:DNA-binding protein H-NS